MFLIDAIKPIVSEAYKIKPVLFLFALDLLAATKTLFKTNEESNYLRVCQVVVDLSVVLK